MSLDITKFSQKLEKLKQENFSEQASYDFFGSLNLSEIEALLKMVEEDNQIFSDEKIKDFLKIYLKRLREEIIIKENEKQP